MSEPKKYPADTPVTLEMLVDIFSMILPRPSVAVIEDIIEPPKPEPKDGELWLCEVETGRMTAVWRLSGRWRYWSDGVGTSELKLTPIKRVLPPEDEA